MFTGIDDGVEGLTLTVTDPGGLSDAAGTTVTVTNADPVITSISATVDPVQVGTDITANGTFADPGVLDTHTAVWNWGDGSTPSPGAVVEADGSGTAGGTHIYTSPGVYTLTLTVTDRDGGSGTAVFEFVVVYDPDGRFVTGDGWIDSPAGAYAADPSLAGKASFGFVSQYKKGTTVPTGQTEFQFKVADLRFHSTEYEWLVVAGASAKFKGSGIINGAGDFGFLLTAIDGQINGGGGVDKFRIKIVDKTSDVVVYDNKRGEADDSDATAALGGGSIIIHKKE
jgi:hypothetical protein